MNRLLASEQDPAWPPPPPGWRHDAPDPPEAFPVPFTVLDGLGLVMWTIVAQILVFTPLVAAGFEPDDGPATLVVFAVTQIFTLFGAAGYLAARGRLSWRSLGPVRPAWRHVGIGLGIGVAGLVIVYTLLVMVQQIAGPVEAPEQSVLESSTAGGLSTVLSIVVAVLLAPVIEEFVFRGVLFQSLRRKLGLWPGLVLSGLAFALVHFEVTQPLFSFALLILGIWLAAAFHRTGSIIVPILGHATFNGVTIALTLAATT